MRTGRTSDVLERAAALYPFDPKDAALIHSTKYSFNDIYAFRKDGNDYILRIATHAQSHEAETLAEMEWLAYLHARGVRVSLPLRMRGGALVASLLNGGKHHAVCAFEKAPGEHCDPADSRLWNAEIWRSWGQTMGSMHSAARSFKPSGYQRPVFDGSDVTPEALADIPDIQRIAVDLLEGLAKLPRNSETFGLIHNDFHQNNFFVHDNRVYVFDFDDCILGYYALDIAVSIYFALLWGMPEALSGRQAVALDIIGHFMEGYVGANSLPPDALRSIPDFMRFRQFSDFCWEYALREKPLLEEQRLIREGIIVPGCTLTEELFLRG